MTTATHTKPNVWGGFDIRRGAKKLGNQNTPNGTFLVDSRLDPTLRFFVLKGGGSPMLQLGPTRFDKISVPHHYRHHIIALISRLSLSLSLSDPPP